MTTQYRPLFGVIEKIFFLLLVSIFLIAPGNVKADGDIELKGTIQAKSDSSITVNLLEIFVDSSTEIENGEHETLTFADLNVGDFVKVEAYANILGKLYASEIRLLDGGMGFEFHGSITAMTSNSFTVNGTEIFVDSNTVILTRFHASLQFSDLKIGDNVFVKADLDTNSLYLASVIWVETQNTNYEIELEGTIQAVSENSITVQNVEFFVDSTTIIVAEEEGLLQFGDLTVGLEVEVRGFLSEDSAYVALIIKVEDDDYTRDDLELEGPIIEIGTDFLVVSGITCYVDSSTVIFAHHGTMLSFSDLSVGDVVEVKALLQEDNTYKAVRIKLENDEDDNEIEVAGTIDFIGSDNFTVGGFTIYVNSETKIYNHEKETLAFEDLTVGTFVKVKAYLQNDTYFALKIKVKDDNKPEIHITGAIDAIAGDTITVKGVVFVTDQNTEFFANKRIEITINDLKVGQIVRVEGIVRDDNSYYAQRIKVENFWRFAVIVEGTIDSLGTNSIKVSDKLFVVDTTTVIIGHGGVGVIDFQSLTLGLRVEIRGIVNSNGVLVAKLIKVHPEHEFEVYGTIDSIYVSQLVVAGLTITTNDETVYYDKFDNEITFDSLKVGQTVEIKYVKTVLNENLAVKIEIESEPGDVEFSGVVTLISSSTIQLSVPSFMINGETQFLSNVYSPIVSSSIQVGQTVTVWANEDGSGNLRAEQVLQVGGEITEVSGNDNNKVPTEFELKQNYPNPFNPTTKISFSLPQPENVVLKVYNIVGQEVASLINEQMNAGRHEVTFNAAKLASGIYFYRLKAGNFVSVKKMMFLK
ncbi:MAG: DUF5666 domain-containing protein [Bacteroidota bacterium]